MESKWFKSFKGQIQNFKKLREVPSIPVDPNFKNIYIKWLEDENKKKDKRIKKLEEERSNGTK